MIIGARRNVLSKVKEYIHLGYWKLHRGKHVFW